MASARHKLAGTARKVRLDVSRTRHRPDDPHDEWGASVAVQYGGNDDPHDPWDEEAIRALDEKMHALGEK